MGIEQQTSLRGIDMPFVFTDSVVLFQRQEPTPPAPVKLPYPQTLVFLERAKDSGVFSAILEGTQGYDRDDITENLAILESYYHSEDSLSDIGQRHFMSKNNAMRRRNQVLELIHRHSPEELREEFPLSRMTLAKPRTLRAKMRISMGRGSEVQRIAQSLQEGSTAMGIAFEFGLDSEKLTKRRRHLKKHGIHLPHLVRGLDTLQKLREADDKKDLSDEEAQDLLNAVTEKLYRSHHGEDDALVSLQECVEEAGYSYKNHGHIFAEVLLEKVPIRSLRKKRNTTAHSYEVRFLLRRHKERTVTILLQAPELARLKKSNAPTAG